MERCKICKNTKFVDIGSGNNKAGAELQIRNHHQIHNLYLVQVPRECSLCKSTSTQLPWYTDIGAQENTKPKMVRKGGRSKGCQACRIRKIKVGFPRKSNYAITQALHFDLTNVSATRNIQHARNVLEQIVLVLGPYRVAFSCK